MNNIVEKKGEVIPDFELLRRHTKNEGEETHLNSSIIIMFKYRQYIYYLIDLK